MSEMSAVIQVELPSGDELAIIRRRFGRGGPGVPRVAIVAGIRGDAPEGIRVAHQVAKALEELEDRLTGVVDVYPCANPLGAHQGTRVVPGRNPVSNIKPRVPDKLQVLELAALRQRNQQHLANKPANPELATRMRAFETAFGMQMAVPEAFDFSRETAAAHSLYGLEHGQTNGFGWQCLAARRLAERGVRFIELIDTGSNAPNNWDSHTNIPRDHPPRAKAVDQPIAALLQDLKQRGLLEETLVVWTTEFGRTPHNDGPVGRSHHPHAWAGGSAPS